MPEEDWFCPSCSAAKEPRAPKRQKAREIADRPAGRIDGCTDAQMHLRMDGRTDRLMDGAHGQMHEWMDRSTDEALL